MFCGVQVLICSFVRPPIFDLWLTGWILDFSGLCFRSDLVLFWLDLREYFFNFCMNMEKLC